MSLPLLRCAFLVSIAVAGACRQPPPCPGECDTAVVAVGADADVLLPVLSQTDVGRAVGHQLFLKLADIGPNMNTVGDAGFEGKLADSWRFEDSLTLVFRLRDDARWHDGVPVTARDVAFSFRLYLDTIVNAPARPLLSRIAGVEALDDHTVAVRFTQWYAQQFYDATHHVYVVPRHLLDSIPRDRLRSHPFLRNPVGNGPYRLTHWRAGETIELGADTTFFLGRPGIQRLVWRITPDPTTSLTQLVAGEVDIIPAIVGQDNIARAQEASHARLVPYPSPVYMFVGFNLRDPDDLERAHPLWGDRALRRAVTLATNRGAIVRAVLGEWGRVAGGPLTPAISIWHDDLRQLPYDSARAHTILTERGWTDTDGDGIRDRDGEPLTFDLLYPSSSRIREQAAVILQDQFRRLGIDTRLVALEFNTFLERAERGHFDALLGGWLADPPPGAIRAFWASDAVPGFNPGRYMNPVFDSLLERAMQHADPTEAQVVWDSALAVINEDAPAIWLFTPTTVAVVARRFENVTVRPDLWAATIWKWRLR